MSLTMGGAMLVIIGGALFGAMLVTIGGAMGGSMLGTITAWGCVELRP